MGGGRWGLDGKGEEVIIPAILKFPKKNTVLHVK